MQPIQRILFGRDGRLGILESPGREDVSASHVKVFLDTGRTIWVPNELLESRPDGNFFIPVTRQQIEVNRQASEKEELGSILVLPVIQEELAVHKIKETSQVRVHKRVHEEEVEVDEPGFTEEVEIQRVAKNEVVESAPAPYTEGDTLVIPILEEILVVEKRLMLREEVRITKHRRETREPQRVTLRREEVVVNSPDEDDRK